MRNSVEVHFGGFLRVYYYKSATEQIFVQRNKVAVSETLGHETSFRELKHAIGLTRFHSKKVEYIKQEIWARMLRCYFCEIITTRVVVARKKTRKHLYQVNYTRAIRICSLFRISLLTYGAPYSILYS